MSVQIKLWTRFARIHCRHVPRAQADLAILCITHPVNGIAVLLAGGLRAPPDATSLAYNRVPSCALAEHTVEVHKVTTTRRLVLAAAFATGLGLLLYGGFRWALAARLDTNWVQSDLSRALGLPVEVARLSVGWDGRAHLFEVSVSPLPSGKGDPLATVAEAVVTIERGRLLHGQFVMTALDLHDVHLTLDAEKWRTILERASLMGGYPSSYSVKVDELQVTWGNVTTLASASPSPKLQDPWPRPMLLGRVDGVVLMETSVGHFSGALVNGSIPRFGLLPRADLKGVFATGSGWKFSLEENAFALQDLFGLEGTGRLQVSDSVLPQSQGIPLVSLSLPELLYKGRKLGKLELRALLLSDRITLLSLVLPGLTGSGTFWQETHQFDLHGVLNRLELSSLPEAPHGLTGQATGHASLSGTPERPVLQLNGKVHKLGYGSLRVAGLAGSGTVWLHTRQADLHGALTDLELAGLPDAPDSLTGLVSGQASLSGTWENPVFQLDGKVHKLALGSVRLEGKAPLGVRASAGALEVNLPRLPFSREGWKVLANVHLTLGLNSKPPQGALLVKLDGKRPGAPGIRGLLEGKIKGGDVEPLRLTVGKIVLNGWYRKQRLRLAGNLAGYSIDSLVALGGLGADWKGNLSGPIEITQDSGKPTKCSFYGPVTDLRGPLGAIGNGQVRLRSWPRLQITGSGFSAASIPVFQKYYPGLTGQVAFRVSLQGNSPLLEMSLRRATWKGRPFPALSAQITGGSGPVRIRSLGVALNPPLTLAGGYDPASGRVALHGRLGGQSLAQLSRVTSGSASSDMQANLAGPIDYQGTHSFRFEGKASAIVSRGLSLGSGHLSLSVTPRLQGTLMLDKPADMAKVSHFPAALNIGPARLLAGVVTLRGVRFSGTLEQVETTPIWSRPFESPPAFHLPRPGGKDGITLPGGGKLRLPFF